MPVDPVLLQTLRAGLEQNPGNFALHKHFATVLLEGGEPDLALDHLTALLVKQPDEVEILTLAAQAAEAAGETTRAESYRRLVDALSWKRTKGLIDSIGEMPPLPETPAPRRAAPEPPDDRRLPVSEQGFLIEENFEGLFEVERPRITLADVAGMTEVKRRLNVAFLAPMQNPDMMRLYGKSLRGGLLLYGPPGCGKTYIARATAGEMGARFMAIGLADVLDMWIGNSEKNLHAVFETARRNAPCVLFFDELDALGRKRSLMRDHGGRNIVNQLLAELDGMDGTNDGVFVLAATNHPWDVDAALRRPGRLDRTLLVLPPDEPARRAILEFNLRDRPVDPRLDLSWIAARTEGYSGADMAHLVESAAELAMEDSITSGTVRPIHLPDFQRALKEVRASVRPWFDTARNYALFANEGGLYDDLANYLRANKML
jgi:SpoVK/Ycf46/Vps4 family AAA+-type ATPase